MRPEDNKAAMEWVERSLEYSRDGGPSNIEGLLEAVREEILFEIQIVENRRPETGWPKARGDG